MSEQNAPDDRPAPKRKRSIVLNVVIGLGVISLLGMLVCGGLLLYAIREPLREIIAAAQPATMPPVEKESPADKRRALKKAFEHPDPSAPEATREGIRALFDKVIAATNGADQRSQAFGSLVDPERFVLEMKKTGLIKAGFTVGEEKLLINSLRGGGINPPANWDRYHIVEIHPLGAGDEAVVTASFWQDDFPSETRLWVIRSGNDWLLYDWDLLQFGTRESFDYAVYQKYAGEPQAAAHVQAGWDIAAAEKEFNTGNIAGAIGHMKLAKSRAVLPELADSQQLRFAYAWRRLRNNRAAVAAAGRVAHPLETPGAFHVLIQSAQEQGRHKKALELIDQYAEGVGGGPAVWKLRATSLTALDRPSEAAVCWEQLLDDSPNDQLALASLVEALAATDVGRIEARIQKTENPLETVVSIAESLWPSSDDSALRALVEITSRLAPESASLEYLRGLQLRHDEEFSEAGAAFWRAYEREADVARKQRDLQAYLDALQLDGRLVEGYRQSPDARGAFAYLTAGIEMGEGRLSADELRSLADAHRQRAPDDPRLAGVEGVLLEDAGKFEAAAAQYALAESASARPSPAAGGDEPPADAAGDLSDSPWRQCRIDALHDAGKDLEAYRTIEPAGNTFQTLVTLAGGSNRRDLLPPLIAAHRESHPDDSWIVYASSLVEEQNGNLAAALRLAQQLFAAQSAEKSAEGLRWMIAWRIQKLCQETGNAEPLLALGEGYSYLLHNLAMQWLGRKDYEALETLIEKRRAAAPDRIDWRRWQISLLWERKDYAGIIRELAPWPAPLTEVPNDFQLDDLRDHLLRSLLRSDRAEEAHAFAQTLADGGSPSPLLVVLAFERKFDDIVRLADDFDNPARWIAGLYDDPDVQDIARSPEFKPVRMEFPPTMPIVWFPAEVVLFLPEPKPMTTESLAADATAILGEGASVVSLDSPLNDPPKRAGQTATWLIRQDSRLLRVAIGTAEILTPTVLVQAGLTGEVRERLRNEQRAWLSINPVATTLDQSWDEDAPMIFRLANRLVPDQLLGAYFSDPGRLVADPAAAKALLTAENPVRELWKLGGVPIQLTQSNASMQQLAEPVDRARLADDRAFRKSLKSFDHRFPDRASGTTFRIAVDLEIAEARERLWLDVDEFAQSRRQGSVVYAGNLTAGSNWLPSLHAGARFKISNYQATDWQITDGTATEQGRPSNGADEKNRSDGASETTAK